MPLGSDETSAPGDEIAVRVHNAAFSMRTVETILRQNDLLREQLKSANEALATYLIQLKERCSGIDPEKAQEEQKRDTAITAAPEITAAVKVEEIGEDPGVKEAILLTCERRHKEKSAEDTATGTEEGPELSGSKSAGPDLLRENVVAKPQEDAVVTPVAAVPSPGKPKIGIPKLKLQ